MGRAKRISYDLIENYISHAITDAGSEARSSIVRDILCDGLTLRQREYLILRYTKKMNGSEIAHMYGVSRSSVSVTLSRARKRIARSLGAQKLREDFNRYISEL